MSDPRDYLRYDNGKLFWTRKLPMSRIKVNNRAGYVNKSTGYRHVRFDGIEYREHHMVWYLVTGKWPNRLDHKDRDIINNVFENLREATVQQNNANSHHYNPLGFRGVTIHGNKFRASIQYNKKRLYLGLHDTPEQAYAAVVAKNTELNGEFACL